MTLSRAKVITLASVALLLAIALGYYAYTKRVSSVPNFTRTPVPQEETRSFVEKNTEVTFEEKMYGDLGCKTPPHIPTSNGGTIAVLCTLEGQSTVKIGTSDASLTETMINSAAVSFAYPGLAFEMSTLDCFRVSELDRTDPEAHFSMCRFKPTNGDATLSFGLYVIDVSAKKKTFIVLSAGTSAQIAAKLQEILNGISFN